MPATSPARATNDPAKLASAGSFSKEFRALLACCRGENSGNDEELGQSSHALDWNRVLELAEFHGVIPQLHQGLNLQGRLDAPSEIRDAVETNFQRNVRKCLRLTVALFEVLDCLDSVGIVGVPFKGPVLAEALYGDVAMREYSDIDVLVRAEDVAKSRDALRSIGFTPSLELSAAKERAIVATGYEKTFHGPGLKNLLEIQWNIVPRFFSVQFDMKAILDRCGTIVVSGRSVPMLLNEDLLLALCVHGAKHLWKRVCWVRDIAMLTRQPGLDWTHVNLEARRLGVCRIVDVSIQLARELFGTVYEQDYAIVDQASKMICEEILRSTFENEELDTESMAYFRWMLRLRERAADRGRFISRLAFTPSIGEWQAVQLPEKMFPLYRVIRVGRLATRLIGLR